VVVAFKGRAAAASPDRIAGLAVAGTDTTDGYRFDLEGGGWLLLRFSGTEPLLRIYTEVVGDKALVDKVLAAGREMIGV
jgi:phosphomannomutase